MKKLAGLFFAASFLYAGDASAQTLCNTPSGFLKTVGTIPLGDALALGPDCNSVQDGGPAGASNLHLVVFTVAPSGATAQDKARADFVGDGVNDQNAVNAAVNAAKAVNSHSKVVMLPGVYNFSTARADIGGGNGFVFEARGTLVNGPGVGGAASGLDTFAISNSNFAEFNFGSIKTNNSGTAAAIHSLGNYSETAITWQALDGTARGGYGYFADTTSPANSQSVNWITATHVQNFAKGIVLSAVGAAANIDTYRVTVDYIYNNAVGIYVHGNSGGSGQINSSVWNVNIDCHAKNGDIAFQTNGFYEIINATIGPVVTVDSGLCTNVLLDPGATSEILTLTPQSLAATSGSIVDNSTNLTNLVNVGMPIALLSANVGNHIVKFSGADIGANTTGQLDDSGLLFAAPVGNQGDVLVVNTLGQITGLAKNTSATRAVCNTGTSNNAAWCQISLATGVTGNLPVANLNSGTGATSSTYWRGDGVWSAVAASGLTGTALPAAIVGSSLTSVGTIGTGTWQGTKIGVAFGGTNADLSATGGANQFVKQTSVGGNPTVAPITNADLASGFPAWTAYTPTYTASNAGAAPTVTTNSARFYNAGKFTCVSIRATITNLNGNTGQNLVISLPNSLLGVVALPFFESGVSGNIGIGIPNGASAVTLNFYSNTLPVTTNTLNYVHNVSGCYENT